MEVRVDGVLDGIGSVRVRADLVAGEVDNGRSAYALRRSLELSRHAVVAPHGMAWLEANR